MTPYWEQDGNKIFHGNALEVLKGMPNELVQMCVTSPPYWGLRDYNLPPMIWDGDSECQHVWGDEQEGHSYSSHSGLAAAAERNDGRKRNPENIARQNDTVAFKASQGKFCQLCGAWRGCLGLEPTPELYIQHMVDIFREVRRVLRSDGVLFCNMGDSYCGSTSETVPRRDDSPIAKGTVSSQEMRGGRGERTRNMIKSGLKPKDLCGIPWMFAFALRSDGWWLRSDIIWHKPNPMPESVTDRPTKAHEYIFLLTKSSRYYYDADAIREKQGKPTRRAKSFRDGGVYTNNRSFKNNGSKEKDTHGDGKLSLGRNKRTVWTIPTQPMPQAHFATFPEKLIEPCILAGSPKGGIVLDPFGGAMTTAIVAHKHNRKFIMIELSQTYIDDIGIPRIEKATEQRGLWN